MLKSKHERIVLCALRSSTCLAGAIGLFVGAGLSVDALAQQSDTRLPAITVEQQPLQKPKPRRATSAARSGQRRAATATRVQQGGNQHAVTGASGVRNSSPTDYKLDTASTGTRSNTPLLNTPMAVQVVPRAALDDKQVISAAEAVKFVSGVQMPTNPFYDNFLIRGFTNANSTYRNGLHLSGIVGFEDIAFVDHIEIAKGPTAMLYGRVQPGGLINYVTRKPEEADAYSIQQQLGGWGLLRTTVDATGPLDKDKTVLYRTIATYDKADSFVDYQHRKNWAGYGALTWRPNGDFEANLQVEHYDQKNIGSGYTAQQVPTVGNRPANLPRNWTQSDPAMWSNFPGSVDRSLVYFDWTYKFSDSWKISQKFHYSLSNETQSYLVYQDFDAATGLMNRQLTYTPFRKEIVATNVDLSGEVFTGPLKHKLLFGVDWFSYRQDVYGYTEEVTLDRVPALNIYNPVYGNIDVPQMWSYINAAAGNALYRHRTRDLGFYVQDEVSLNERLFVLLGGRYDIAQEANAEIYGDVSQACFPNCDGHLLPQTTAAKFSPRLGVLYKLTPELSVYGSYSQSFGSSHDGVSYDGSPFAPETGVQYEAGAKAALLDGKVSASVTLFDLYLRNRLTTDPDHVGFSIAAGEVRSRGLEFDIAGQVTRHVSLIASYTYDDARVTADSATGVASTLGNQWPGVPYNSASLWAKYDDAPGEATAWFTGAGFYAVGERQGNVANKMQLPGYGRVDAMVGYRTRLRGVRWTAQLNVQNLLDAAYFESSNGTYSLYGAPRGFVGSLKAEY